MNKKFEEMSKERLEKELRRISINIKYAVRRGDKVALDNLKIKKATIENLIKEKL